MVLKSRGWQACRRLLCALQPHGIGRIHPTKPRQGRPGARHLRIGNQSALEHSFGVVKAAVRSPGASGNRRLVRDDGTPVSDEIENPQARSVLSSLGQLDEAVIALGKAFDVIAVEPAR